MTPPPAQQTALFGHLCEWLAFKRSVTMLLGFTPRRTSSRAWQISWTNTRNTVTRLAQPRAGALVVRLTVPAPYWERRRIPGGQGITAPAWPSCNPTKPPAGSDQTPSDVAAIPSSRSGLLGSAWRLVLIRSREAVWVEEWRIAAVGHLVDWAYSGCGAYPTGVRAFVESRAGTTVIAIEAGERPSAPRCSWRRRYLRRADRLNHVRELPLVRSGPVCIG
jgi:hypothetical protein